MANNAIKTRDEHVRDAIPAATDFLTTIPLTTDLCTSQCKQPK